MFYKERTLKFAFSILAIVIISIGVFWFYNRTTPELATSPSSETTSTVATSSSPMGTASSNPSKTPPASTSTTITPIPPTKNDNLQFGIAAGGGLTTLSQSNLLNRLTAIKAIGVEWVRFDIDWSVIQQGGPNSYNWKGVDNVVEDLNALGLKGLGIITYAPQWAGAANCSENGKCAPTNPAQFATFAQAVVQRYAPQGMHTWEIWNEPNLNEFWQPAPNVADYSQDLQAAYTAIKKVDSSSFIISGGLSRTTTGGGDISPTDFLTALYANGAKGYFDAVAIHPYTYPLPPSDFQTENAWSQIASTSPSIRSIMVQNGDGNKKIWITEYGAPTGGVGTAATADNYTSVPDADHVSEAFQAQMISEAVTSAKAMPWVQAIFIYTYTDIMGSPSYNENFFGLIRSDGSTKPAYTTLKDLISQ